MGWQCTTRFEDGLLKTIEYYVEEHKKEQRDVQLIQQGRKEG